MVFPLLDNPPDWRKGLSNGVKTHLFKLKSSKIKLCGKKLFLGEGGGRIEMHNIYPCFLFQIAKLYNSCNYITFTWMSLSVHYLFNSKRPLRLFFTCFSSFSRSQFLEKSGVKVIGQIRWIQGGLLLTCELDNGRHWF